jgi:hypothetical protein
MEIFLYFFESSRRFQNEITAFEKKENGPDLRGSARSELGWPGPGDCVREGAIQITDKRALAVSESRVPNRYQTMPSV